MIGSLWTSLLSKENCAFRWLFHHLPVVTEQLNPSSRHPLILFPSQLKTALDLESTGLQFNIDVLAARVTDLENDLGNDMRKEFNEAIEAQKLDLQVKADDAIEQRLADAEEVVKRDFRIALEHARCSFKIKFGWPEDP